MSDPLNYLTNFHEEAKIIFEIEGTLSIVREGVGWKWKPTNEHRRIKKICRTNEAKGGGTNGAEVLHPSSSFLPSSNRLSTELVNNNFGKLNSIGHLTDSRYILS